MLGPDDSPVASVPQNAPLRFRVTFAVREPVRFLELYVRVTTPDGLRLFTSFSGQIEETIHPGRYAATCAFGDHRLSQGRYGVELTARAADPEDIVPSAMAFQITSGVAEDDPRYASNWTGVVRVDSSWTEFEAAETPEVESLAR
jgi:hypothetical protein